MSEPTSAVTFTGVDNRGALQFTPKELADHDREVRRETLEALIAAIRRDWASKQLSDINKLDDYIRSLLDGQEEGHRE